MKKPLKIYLDYGEAYGNLGDEAMLISAMDRLNSYLGNCKFILPIQKGNPLPDLPPNIQFVNTPRWIFRVVGRLVRLFFCSAKYLPYFKRFVPSEKEKLETLVWKNADRIITILLPLLLRLPTKLSKTIDILKSCDIFYAVGDASLNDYNLRNFVYKSWLYRTARPYVGISVASSQGIGPVNIQWAKKKMKEVFENLDFLSFRDCCFGKSVVDELRLPNLKYSIVADEAFSLSIGKEEHITALLEESGLQDETSFVAFHFRATDYTKDTTFLFRKAATLLDEICKIVPHFFIFFPMSYHIHSKYDEQCGKAIKELMLQPERLLLAPVCKNVRIVKGAIGRALYSLGLSYHVHVFALSQGKPSIILYTGEYYQYKSDGLIGFYDKPCKALDLEQVSNEEVLRAIRSLEDNYQEAVKMVATVNKRILDNNDWHLREMKSRLD